MKEERKKDIGLMYGRKRLMLPEAQFAVFYNGTEKLPERVELKLSESFLGRNGESAKDELFEGQTEAAQDEPGGEPDEETLAKPLRQMSGPPQLELRVQVWNINPGYNEPLKEQCLPLKEYMQYVECVREKAKVMPVKDAVPLAVDQCIREGILSHFLRQNKAEVMPMSIYEYNEEVVMKVIREQEREFGREEGRNEGLKEGLEEGLKNGEKKAVTNCLQLIRQLLKDGRQEELWKATEDDAYFQKLLSECGSE
ncbi:MAG: hypothetical protein NC432_09895 [Roseburia sp.]|nr:hypothetical protein [Roseburia sp.]MCM1098710.1 hypothetical protein [Ruminococcus flavefaciens]